VQGDAAVRVTRDRQDAGTDRVEDLVVAELAVDAGGAPSGTVPAIWAYRPSSACVSAGNEPLLSPRMIGASLQCAQIWTLAQPASSAADPA
jgi:hypothetical protein